MNLASRDLLVISDLHLGDRLGPKTPEVLELERQLVSFLDAHGAENRSLRLVINGDMLEMVGLPVLPSDVGVTGDVHPHDHRYGLGGRAHAAAAKLKIVLAYHDAVFDALARFLAAGHQVGVVIGNHDIELSWPEVQRVFVDDLVRRGAPYGVTEAQTRQAFTFHRWFYYERDVAWIEHGHQYDPYCSFEEQLEPATDNTEIDPTPGGLLPRYVVPRIGLSPREMPHTFFGYLRLWLGRGVRQIFDLLRAYLAVCRRMIEHWRTRQPERVAARQARARTHLRVQSEAFGLSEDVLRDLAGLAETPVTMSLGRIVRALMMDRLFALTFGPLLVFPLLLLPWEVQPYVLSVALVPLVGACWMSLMSREPTDPSEAMRRNAQQIRRRMRVRYVIMGHSHRALVDGDADGAYLNCGHWGGDAKAFTFVRIVRGSGAPHAQLCQWRADRSFLAPMDRPAGGVRAAPP